MKSTEKAGRMEIQGRVGVASQVWNVQAGNSGRVSVLHFWGLIVLL